MQPTKPSYEVTAVRTAAALRTLAAIEALRAAHLTGRPAVTKLPPPKRSEP